MRRLIMLAVPLMALIGLSLPAQAVTNGTYDGNNHPYVGYEDNQAFACTGTLLSPTVMLTAAHCFSDSTSGLGTNTTTGAPLVRVSFDPNLINTPAAQRTWYVGAYYSDPQWVIGAKGGVPALRHPRRRDHRLRGAGLPHPDRQRQHLPLRRDPRIGHPRPVRHPARGQPRGQLAANTAVDVAGYGVQGFVNGGGPCDPNCKKSEGASATRFFATTTLVASNDTLSDEFIKVHSNKGGTCFGDSGGPNLLGGTNVVLAVNSFVANSICSGNTYSYRVDTPEALAWITSTAIAHGGGF